MANSDKAHLKEIAAKDMALAVCALLEQKDPNDESAPFYDAWAALKLERAALERGLARAIAIQKDIVQQVKTIIDKKIFHFQYEEQQVPHRLPFQGSGRPPPCDRGHRLAAFLMAVFDRRFQKNGQVPVAICLKDPSNDPECWLCVGAAKRPVTDYGNELVKYFDEATRSSNANTANHFIDKAVWQVHADHFEAWCEALKEISKTDVSKYADVSASQEKMTGETGESPSTGGSSPSTQAESPEESKESLTQSAAAAVTPSAN